MRRAGAIAALMLAVFACLAAGASARVPNVSWTSYLPALPSPNGNSGGPQPGCAHASIRCIDGEIRRMATLQRQLGCDHRAVFDTTYLELTKVLRNTLARNPHLFRDRDALTYEDALFADVYFRTVHAWAAGKPVDPAWRIAFQVARDRDVSAAADMLLGINAHVQNDMPFVLAAITLRDSHGRSRKPDHDTFNAVLNEAYTPVVHAIERRYDPFVTVTNSDATPLDDVAGLEMVRAWREGVWRNAERLVNAKTDAQRAQVAQQIHEQAAVTAEFIATGGAMPPGYRARRDAYCHAGGSSSPKPGPALVGAIPAG